MTDSHPSIAGVRFKSIAGFDYYAFGDDGSVWSRIPRGKRRAGEYRAWNQLRSSPDQNGYPKVHLVDGDGVKRCYKVARMILTAFVGPKPEGQETRHLNGRPSDSRLQNLAWSDRKTNHSDKYIHGTMPFGERSGKAKLTEAVVIEMRQLHARGAASKRELALRFGVSRSAISHVLSRRVWGHVA